MEFEAYHSVIILFWALCTVFIVREYKQASLLKDQTDRRYLYATLTVLCAGVLCRTLYPSYPFGVFSDEAIGGYDAWCLANYGVDSNLASFPVYLKSWGTGQSAVYAYCAVPFIKLFGLSTAVFRLPMALVSCISLMFLYYTLRKIDISRILQFLIVSIFIISPWHLMSSRWALDCNLCPHFMLIATCFFVLSVEKPGTRSSLIYVFSGSAVLAVAAYSYAISWLMLPFFTILLFIYLYRIKVLNVRQIVKSALFMFVLLIPIICFAFVLVFDLESFKLGFLTITKLASTRVEMTSWIGFEDKFWSFLYYIRNGVMLLITGNDIIYWNSFRYWGQFYNIIALPFILLTVYDYIKNKKLRSLDVIFLFWTVSLVLILLFIDANVNHWNLLWPPLTYFLAKGIFISVSRFRVLKFVLYPLFGILAICFTLHYSKYYKTSENVFGFVKGLEEVVPFAETLPVDIIYNRVRMSTSYPSFLFYSPIDPNEYMRTRIVNPRYGIYGYDYGRYYCDPESPILPLAKTAYILRTSELEDVNLEEYNIHRGKYFSVLWNE